jgi:23S rRNA pseudouridine1911/1915/1917 synthase
MQRMYICVAHGVVTPGRIESNLVADRGDGLRGSTSHAGQGKRAITHVSVRQALRGATLCEVKLETGKTHQIRIHLAESGHPLVGETVYIRDYAGPLIASPRMLLHAATLGFEHPVTGAHVSLTSPLPSDFTSVVEMLTLR